MNREIIQNSQFEKQKNAIIKLLRHANMSPYYNNLFKKNKINLSEMKTYNDFCQIPILSKSELEKNKAEMIVNKRRLVDINTYVSFGDDFAKKMKYLDEREFYLKVTSGSTGSPVEIFKSKDDLKREYLALNYFRRKILGDVPRGAYIWIWPANKYIRKYFYENLTTNVYKDSSYGYKYMMEEYSDESFRNLTEFIIKNRINWITAPPSMLYLYCDFLCSNNYKLKFEYIECHSEKLHLFQAEKISKTLGVFPISVYSANEVQFMGISCKKGNMHIIPQNVFMELIPGKDGRNHVIATSLACFDLPIIRYDLSDIAEYFGYENCNCGIVSPIIKLKEYRNNDYLITDTGKRYEPFILTDLIMLIQAKYFIDINEYIIRQNNYNSIILYFNDDVLLVLMSIEEFIGFVKSYLADITGVDFQIHLSNINLIKSEIGVNKFKHFISGEF